MNQKRSLPRRRTLFAGLAGLAGAVGAGGVGALAHRGGWRRREGPDGALPSIGPVTYVAIGASDAVGFCVRSPRRDGWVPQLASKLPQPVELVNLGVPGSTLRQALEQQLPRAVAAKPDLVTVWLVVNDVLAGVSPQTYAADLDRLLRTLRT